MGEISGRIRFGKDGRRGGSNFFERREFYKELLNGFINAGRQRMYFPDFDGFNNLDPDAGIFGGGTLKGGGGGGNAI